MAPAPLRRHTLSRMPERTGDVSEQAIAELGAIASGLREQIDVDDAAWDAIVRALTHALMAGVRIGGVEVAAQAIESGLPVQLNLEVAHAPPDED